MTHEPTTAAGRAHVEWLMQANVPHFTGEIYRSNHTASVRAIEAEARQQDTLPALDVERLARALQRAHHSTEVRDHQGRLIDFDELGSVWQLGIRKDAERIAVEYARLQEQDHD